ncbi:MAG: hypothetical protein WBY53_00405 [Acidobacteriaceae bacterium]
MNTRQKVSFRAVRVNPRQASVLVAGVLLCLFSAGCLKIIEPPVVPPAPEASAKIATAKTVFVSNLGADTYVTRYLAGGPNESYAVFSSSLKQWGRFELVDSPKTADLIFEIYTTEKAPDVDHTGAGFHTDDFTVTRYPVVVSLTVKDASTLNILWSTNFNIMVYGNTKNGQEKHFAQDIEGLTNEVKALVTVEQPGLTSSK